MIENALQLKAKLPPGPRWPALVQAVAYGTARQQVLRYADRRFGSAFTARLPVFGHTVVISDPALIKQLFQTSTDVAQGVRPNLDTVLGPGSTFGLQGEEHHRRRKLLIPPFHGKRMRAYEDLIEHETLREISTWSQGREFSVMPSTMRITLNAILRAVFGAHGAEFEVLRDLMPKMVHLGSPLVLVPWMHRDLGRWSPWGKFMAMRRQFDHTVGVLIERAQSDPHFNQREDVLSLMLQARYDDGTSMSHSDIGDELLTLLAAGHETTATSLAWAVERLRRHPEILAQLVEEVDSGGTGLLQATVYEVQRVRPVIDGALRHIVAPMMLGPWVIPAGTTVIVHVSQIHNSESVFPDAETFNPQRFLGGIPDTYSWVPFGGGTRRCLGAAFANMEMNTVLRTILREFTLAPTTARGERWHNRGVAAAPSGGGRALVYRRSLSAAGVSQQQQSPAV
ncbi:cytochrome P450 [Mycobacteroides abscessus]|uniref:cytochrome P450 n=1 Tax=Mycobacteroides abscessus TaxID=36809 RepID=UPI00040E878B|nr:cytochrome P450 [Mycobacteroides abscessus]MBN7548428.1 cytochrome P450 [Mycobacteroides abscessus subsp. abscessus]MDM2692250.1 cytochrome P450 [Mycobacteroides abscessus]MDM2697062.1 cytochrome P450 [Mycobacteroides abscessus]MDM2702214.1 cytochrome P450 [Mycobacteroides abscessus]MDO3265661.1 cytochrome P450 [Mycobacteroides abscessus subsp. abscessus]